MEGHIDLMMKEDKFRKDFTKLTSVFKFRTSHIKSFQNVLQTFEGKFVEISENLTKNT